MLFDDREVSSHGQHSDLEAVVVRLRPLPPTYLILGSDIMLYLLFKRKLNYFDFMVGLILIQLLPWYLMIPFWMLALCISVMGEDALEKLEKLKKLEEESLK
jgi:hypothetical protein